MSGKGVANVENTTTQRKLHVDAETRALMASPDFRRLLETGRASAAQGLLSGEDLDRQRPITAEEAAAADERIARLEAEDASPAEAPGQNGAARL
jgi:hypothetical protein